MTVNYRSLWVRLAERDMSKEDLRTSVKISSSTMAKLGKNEIVSMEILMKICEYLNCNISDVMTFEK